MPRGGRRPNTKVESNHLFKPKWNNKKTTAIRIPEVFKDCFIALARYLDKSEFSGNFDINLVDKVVDYDNVKSDLNEYQSEIIKLREENIKLSQEINNQTNQNKQKNQPNNYLIAVECFGEFVEKNDLTIEDLSKARKGTKKHQLYEINQWLLKKSNSNVVINDYY